MKPNYISQSGQSLVELMLGIGLLAIVIPALLTGVFAGRQGQASEIQRAQAVTLLKEAQEAVRNIRDSGWTLLPSDGATYYHPVITSGAWSLISGAETVNGFNREILFSDVCRDITGKIAVSCSGNTVDPSTKLVTTTVSWTQPTSSSIQSSMYLTRFRDNLTHIETTVADFTGVAGNESNLQGTAITNVSGGEVKLSNVANGDWCKPQNFIVNQINLPKLSNAIYAQQGGVYLGSGDGTSGSPAFMNVAINTPAPPATPSASIVGTFNGAFTTNSIYSDGRYVYLATTNNPQVIILDLSLNPYAQVGSVTVPGGQPANSVALSGNILFVTSGNSLYTFDVTTKTGSHTNVKSSINMVAGIWPQPTARQVAVSGNMAYVGTGGSLLGLQSFSFKPDGTGLKFYAAALLTFSQQSQGLYVDATGHYAYMAFNNASGINFTRGMAVIDLTKTSWFIITFYNTYYTFNTQGMDPRGITVPANNRAIVVGIGGTQQYQVIDTTSLSNMSLCGGLNVSNGILGVSSILDQYNTAYSYIITGEAGNQFKIIRGGQGGGGYVTSGTFESVIFDAGLSTSFNRFTATINQPAQTTIQMQVGVSAPNGNCSSTVFNYVGPNGISGSSPSAYFSPVNNIISGTIPFGNYGSYQNPNRCFRYKAYLSTANPSNTPELDDMTVNYSP